MNNETFDLMFKIVLIGDSNVGKTNMLSRYIKDEFDTGSKATVGVEFANKNYSFDNVNIKCQIWDTAGQERYRSVTSAYYRGCKGCIIIYDITDRKSFLHLEDWAKEIKNNAEEDLVVLMVGNKCDLETNRAVTLTMAQRKAKDLGWAFIETSAKMNKNIDLAFEILIKTIYKKYECDCKTIEEMERMDDSINLNNQRKNNSGCC